MRLYPFLFLISFTCFGQNTISIDEKRDSLLYYLEKAQDSLRIPYLKKAMRLAKETENDLLLSKSIIEYADASYFSGDSIERAKGIQILKSRYTEKKDSSALAKFYHIKAMQFKKKTRLDSSFYYYQESKSVSELLKDSIQAGRRLLSMGLMQKNENDLVGAEATLIEGLTYLEPLDEQRFTASTYNNLGLVLIRFSRFNEAREYFKLALNLHKDNIDEKSKERGILDYYNNMGFSYLNELLFDQAKEYLTKGLDLKIKFQHNGAKQALLGNLAECFYDQNEEKEAWKKFKLLLSLREKDNNIFGQSLSHNSIAYYYLRENNKKKALFHAQKGYEFAKQVNNNATMLSALLKLGELTLGSESKKYYKEHAELSDSLNTRERNFRNSFAKIRYETEKKDKENTNLKLVNEQKQREAENQRLQKIIFGLSGIIILIFSIAFFRNRRKKMMYEAQLQKASAREEERQQIAKSLHDEVAGDLRMLHQKLVKSNQEEAKNIETIKENVRNLSHQLSSVSFEEVSFKDQLINLISDVFTPEFRISTEGIDSVSWEKINSTIKRTVYLCIRESLQNTVKHAEASSFVIAFSKEKKGLVVELKDNGKGIDEHKNSKGIGLKNLKERVEEIHGSFEVESSEEGTETRIRIPING